MKKNFCNRKNIILIVLLIGVVAYSIFYNYFKYSHENWLKHFSNTSALDVVSNYSFWWFILTGDIVNGVIYMLPVILTTIACYSLFKIYHTGFFHNIVQRIGYKRTFLIEITKCWMYSMLLPVLSMFTLIVSKILYKNNVIALYKNVEGYPIQLVNSQMEQMNPYLFIILHIFLCILLSISIINIGIIFTKYLKKFYLVPILTFIVVILIENLNNLLFAPIIANITGITEMYNGFSLYNLYYLDAIPSMWWEFVFALSLFIITTTSAYLTYKNKESVCLEYE